MATNKQEVELIIRAREIGTKSFKTTAESIKGLSAALDKQIDAATRGEASAAALTSTMGKLEKAGSQLIKQQGLIDFHRQLSEQLSAAEIKAKDAAEAHRTLAAAQEAAEKVTRTEVRQLASLEKAATAAEKRIVSIAHSLALQEAALAEAGLDTDNLADAQQRLSQAAQEVGTALAQAGSIVDGYDEQLKRLKATQDKVAAEATFARTLEDARQLQQATTYVDFWNKALQESERQERELAEVEAFRQKLADAKQLREAASYVDFWTQSLDRAEQQERQLAELNAFRKIGDDAASSAASVNRFGASANSAAAGGSKFAKSLQAMIDPAGAARATLAGLEAEIERVSAEVGDGSKQVREYQEAFNDLGRVQAAIMRQATAIDAYKDQAQAVDAATASLEQHRAKLLADAAAVRNAEAPSDQLAATLREQEAATNEAARALDNEIAKLNKLRAPLDAAKINTAELANEQNRLAAVSRKTAAAVNTLDGAMKGQGSRTGRFLGMRPYELQNLGYQLNDVFTQLASGTSITQTFAQQSGQFIQIPGVLKGIVRFLPQLTAVVVVLGSTYAAIKRITDLEASVRSFSKELNASADGALYNAKALAQTARAIEDTGVKAKDAQGAVSAFVKRGVDPTQILAFTMAARAMSKVTGDDLPTAAGKMADAFTRGYDAIAKLDDELNFLTAAERLQIKAMFDAGKSADAQKLAFERLQATMSAGAASAKGPWTDAIKSLSNAWREFLDWLGRSEIIQNTIRDIKLLAGGVEWLAKNLPGAGGGAAGSPSATVSGGGRRAGGGVLSVQRERYMDSRDLITGGPGSDPAGVARNREQMGMLFGTGSETRPTTVWDRLTGNTPAPQPIKLTDELRDLAAMTYMEALKDPQAQRDVAAVILNRMERSGQSASAVVRAPGQFEPYSNRRQEFNQVRSNDELMRRVLENLLPIIEGDMASPVGAATMFVSPAGQAAARDGRQVLPDWAKPENKTQERYGHQFYTGAFVGDRGLGGTANAASQQDQKAGNDYLAELEAQRAATQQVTDAERVRQAGLVALREAQNRGAEASQQEAAKAYAEQTEQFAIDRERAEQRIALAGEIASSASAAAKAQDQSLSQRIAAVTQQYDLLFAKIKEGKDRGLTEVNGQSLEAIEAQARADMEAVKQRETMAFYEEKLASVERERGELLSRINSELTNGTISAREAIIQTQATNERFGPQIKAIADEAGAFAESIRTATPSAKLEAFIAKMVSAGPDAAAATARASLKIYEDSVKGLTQARDDAIRGVLDQLDQGEISSIQALQKAQEIQAKLNPGIAEMAQSAVTFAQGISGAVPSPALSAFIESMQQVDNRASAASAGTNAKSNPVAGVGLAAMAAEEEKLNAIIARRNEQAGIYNTLVERRVMTETEARAATASLYAETQPLIDAQVTAMQTLLANLMQLGIITPQVYDLWVVKLQGVNAEAGYLDDKVRGVQNQLEQAFATGMVSSFTTALGGLIKGTEAWNQRVAEGKSAFTAARDAFRNFAADFLAQIAQMIIQQMILNALQSAAGAGGGTGGGWFGSLARMIVPTKHTGGLGGEKRGKTSGVSPLLFLNAPKYHGGRNPLGLDATEEAAIIKKDEEILTSDNPRHIKNLVGGGAGGGAAQRPITDLTINNMIDPGDVTAKGIESKAGGEAFMNWLGNNARAVKARLGE